MKLGFKELKKKLRVIPEKGGGGVANNCGK